MDLDELRVRAEALWARAQREAHGFVDPYVVVERLSQWYRDLEAGDRVLAQDVLCEWLESDVQDKRGDAVTLIGEFRVVRAVPALFALSQRLAHSADPRAALELERVEDLLAELPPD